MQAVADVFAWIAREHETQGAAIEGKWTNDGDVTAAAEGRLRSHYLGLYLRVDGNDVSGIVQSRALNSRSDATQRVPQGTATVGTYLRVHGSTRAVGHLRSCCVALARSQAETIA